MSRRARLETGSKPERVLKLRGHLAVLRPKTQVIAVLVDPSLVEREEQIIAWLRVQRTRLCQPMFLDRLSYWIRFENHSLGVAA